MSLKFYGGVPIYIPNTTYNLEDKGCYISYNIDVSYYGSKTTAIVREDGINPIKFLILNGNHIEELLKLKTYEKCVEYFKSHLELKNKYSENWDEEFYFENGKAGYRKITN